jgi:two-component system cell cycle sensor histidine kinase/response regulator CckA
MPGRGSSTHLTTVLLVEDDASEAVLMTRWLSDGNFKVFAAEDGREAIELADATPEPIDVLVVDVMLPGMSGPVLAGVLRRLHPEAAVLFTSGHSPELVAEISAPHTKDALVLRKPFTGEELLAKIAMALARRSLSSPGSRHSRSETRSTGASKPNG